MDTPHQYNSRCPTFDEKISVPHPQSYLLRLSPALRGKNKHPQTNSNLLRGHLSFASTPKSNMEISQTSNYITTHDAAGRAIFSKLTPESPPEDLVTPFGIMNNIFTTSTHPANLANDTDIKDSLQYRHSGLPRGSTTIPGGSAGALVHFKPQSVSPMHRTTSLDYGVVVDGVVELHLDSGEVRTMKKGDTIVQRNTMHLWKNVTPDEGWASMFFVALDIVQLEVNGKKMESEWHFDWDMGSQKT